MDPVYTYKFIFGCCACWGNLGLTIIRSPHLGCAPRSRLETLPPSLATQQRVSRPRGQHHRRHSLVCPRMGPVVRDCLLSNAAREVRLTCHIIFVLDGAILLALCCASICALSISYCRCTRLSEEMATLSVQAVRSPSPRSVRKLF